MAKSHFFQSILIANRGEIACRIIRTAKAMGLRTIAVYSDADRNAPHVKQADEAIHIGPPPVGESYLDMERILSAAKESGADAVHPGYGFLSENASFAKACAGAGLIFIGPTPDAIDLMGDKAKAKRRMIEAGVPCVPGYQDKDQSDAALTDAAQKVGFPIMVKAAAGGGGRGMRLVTDEKNLAAAIKTARSEAENAFGSGDLILERAIIRPRHVEIQVFADSHGHVVHLGERDCSVQRRHQKVLEEAPSPAVDAALREKMGASAVKAAKDIGYVGAGTVEFLLDQSGAFYFLEMNTRLQVEHPVTEMVTGFDLVEWQIRVARGEPLGFAQDDVNLTGHAIEARLYAEDVSKDFLPATGAIDFWRPASGDGVRIDAGIATGGEVSPYYDPMLAKVIAHGTTREDARARLVEALKETALFGVATNRKFLIDALERPAFVNGEATTAFIGEAFTTDDLSAAPLSREDAAIASALLHVAAREAALEQAVSAPRALLNWSSGETIKTPYRFECRGEVHALTIAPTERPERYSIETEDSAHVAKVKTVSSNAAEIQVDNRAVSVLYNLPDGPGGGRIQVSIGGRDFDLVNLNAVAVSAEDAAGAGAVTAPMHGMLIELFAKEGDVVQKGDRLAVLEAMKMQHELIAEIDGKVAAVHATPGVQVAADTLLMEIEGE